MRLAISNIAWDVAEDEAVAELLGKYSVDAIDVAHPKYFPDVNGVDDGELSRVRNWWAQRGIEITGMQSLLFGTSGLNLFGTAQSREAMLDHLGSVCRIGYGLGATRLVFGSPKNRDRVGLTDEGAERIALPFLNRLGDIAESHRVTICLEPNPPCYGCNFMTTTDETARIVRMLDHPAIKIQLDTGAIAINGENPENMVTVHSDIIGHIHASEPGLVTLGDGGACHDRVASALRAALPDHVVSIEMLAAQNEPHLSAIEKALRLAISSYGDYGGEEA